MTDQPHKDRKPGVLPMVGFLIASLPLLYFGGFVVILLDGFVFRSHLFLKYAADEVVRVARFIYGPLLRLVEPFF